MHRGGAGRGSGGQQGVDVEIAFGRFGRADVHGLVGRGDVQGLAVGVGVDRHGAGTKGARAAHDTAGDFAAIGNQDFIHSTLA